jgi:hypothetical protein
MLPFLGRVMASAITMQILCWISIALISHGSSLNVDRLSNRWARSDDGSDGWQASNGPYNPGPYPISRPVVTEVVPTALTASTASTFRKVDEGLPFLTAASAEGFYEVLVGKKSPISETMGVGGGNSPTGSPDVIIGRVMSSTTGIESTTTASAAIGYSHPPQPIVPVPATVTQDEKKKADEEVKAEERSKIRDALEMESRSTSDDSLIKKNDYSLPPGSFYLPAVSRKDHQYYSDSEKSIYIPLRRKDPLIQAFPVTTRVVLVNKNQPVTPVVFSQPPAIYHSKEGDEEEDQEVEETEEQETRFSTEEEEENDEEDNEEDPNISHRPQRPTIQPTTPVQSHSSALDLVMTLYPNLPKLIPPSYFNSQTIKNFLKLNSRPAAVGGGEIAGSTSVIHESKVVTPPQGYLPQLLPKPIPKPAIVKGNALLTQFKSPNKVNFGTAVAASAYPSEPTRHQSTKPTTGPTKTTIRFVPFTSEDISPLNFLLAPVSSATERVTATEQPDTRSNYVAGIIPTNNGDVIADSNVHITQRDPLKIVPAPKLDFLWNQFRPLPAEISHQPSAASDLTQQPSVVTNINQHHKQQQPQNGQDHKQQDERTSASVLHQNYFVPPETAEVVVRSKMATSGSESGNDVRTHPTGDSADIITGYFDGQPILPTTISQTTISPTTISPAEEKEKQTTTTTTTTTRGTTVPPIPVEEIATTTATVPSRTDEMVRPTIPSIPELHGNFQPSFGKFPYSSPSPQDHSHQPELASDVPLVSSPVIRVVSTDHDDRNIFSVPHGLPNLADDQHVAGSQIHETSVYEENIPRVRPIKPQSAAQEVEVKASAPYYKMGKMSPKGAMYTVTQGHSKVKFFGYNALHNGELKPIDSKYLASLLQKHEQQQLEHDWKFSPYLPIRSTGGGGHSAFKSVPKKSIPIANGKKPTIRPVFFAKRPGSSNPDISSSKSSQGSPSNAPWHPSIVVSEPFEYHAHLQKMAEDQGRLPISQSPPT